MSTLTAIRGLPGSGKTTLALNYVASDPAGRARCNRDSTRDQLHGARTFSRPTEKAVTVAQHAAIRALLRAGIDVIVDDMNLRDQYLRNLRLLADSVSAGFKVIDLTDVPVDVCVERDALRPGVAHVGEEVIRTLWERHIRGRGYPLPLPAVLAESPFARPYTPPAGGIPAVLVDIDGTMALMNGRGPYDEHLVGTDLPNMPVIATVAGYDDIGYRVIFMSGRTDGCRADTEAWLANHYPRRYEALHMRAAGDTRRDSIVKLELFDAHVRDRYSVFLVLDDRRQVVDAWRAIGLTVFQVAEGNF